MIITLLIVACVLLSVAVVILFTVLKRQRNEISALKICVCALAEENYDENGKVSDLFRRAWSDFAIERCDYTVGDGYCAINKNDVLDILDDGITNVSKKQHKDYAITVAPSYDYFLYLKCPYRNEFDDSSDCEIWNCPACGEGCNLICKGLKNKESENEKKTDETT